MSKFMVTGSGGLQVVRREVKRRETVSTSSTSTPSWRVVPLEGKRFASKWKFREIYLGAKSDRPAVFFAGAQFAAGFDNSASLTAASKSVCLAVWQVFRELLLVFLQTTCVKVNPGNLLALPYTHLLCRGLWWRVFRCCLLTSGEPILTRPEVWGPEVGGLLGFLTSSFIPLALWPTPPIKYGMRAR